MNTAEEMLLASPQQHPVKPARPSVCEVGDFAVVPSELPVKIILYVLIEVVFMPVL